MDVAQVRQKARQGLKANAFRHVSVQAMGAVTTIVLARHLTPHQFGAFGALSLATQFFTVWGGLGIGVVLIRQLEEPTEGEMNAAFGFQILLSSLLCLALGFSAPLIEIFVRPAAAAINISAATWVLAACAWLTSLRLIPNVRLQRGIDFVNLAWVEFAENLAYNVTAIILAFSGTGVWALLVATLARAITGCALLSVFSPWRPTRQIDLSRLRRVVALGFSFESIPIISFAKDLALPAFIGTTLGLTHLGYFVWARDLGTKFVTFGRLYGKVAFPTFSRLDEDESAVRDFLARSFQLLGLFYWPAVTSFIAISHPLIAIVFGEKWLPARPFLILFVFGLLQQIWSAPAWALIQARSSGGWPLRTIGVMTVFEISAAYPAVRFLGLTGAGVVLFLSMFIFNCLALAEIRTSLPSYLARDFLRKAFLNGLVVAISLGVLHEQNFSTSSAIIAMAGVCLIALIANMALFRHDRQLAWSIIRQCLPLHASARRQG
ncbi:MAG: oligosaccharide flippase family protein [Terrimicrobiaceae bacterium]